ncbi:GNAT family N-acetyltransferase [Halospeciosus flavus]|uniref:GNAT family N-acetyltransferase n=1 Tax=Halospeciosus flavus TaxID=3032283 RepID=A0ABD5Z5I4_9EURY|nr:GNAT family N-acetyltransferase [Halospeciosus flavus]
MQVRELREGEVPTLVDDLWFPFAREMADLDSYNELADGDLRPDALAYRHDRFADDDVATFVAVVAGDLVGYATVERKPSPPVFARGPSGNVGEVYVAPDHRGAGVATALLDAAESWAREEGCERVTLSVNRENESARALYESRGYDVRRLKMDAELDGHDG